MEHLSTKFRLCAYLPHVFYGKGRTRSGFDVEASPLLPVQLEIGYIPQQGIFSFVMQFVLFVSLFQKRGRGRARFEEKLQEHAQSLFFLPSRLLAPALSFRARL